MFSYMPPLYEIVLQGSTKFSWQLAQASINSDTNIKAEQGPGNKAILLIGIQIPERAAVEAPAGTVG
jgi:hypothetical protein